jgi:hypothetical protein
MPVASGSNFTFNIIGVQSYLILLWHFLVILIGLSSTLIIYHTYYKYNCVTVLHFNNYNINTFPYYQFFLFPEVDEIFKGKR